MSRLITSSRPHYPRVKITDNALEAAHGHIYVDLDGMHELLRDDLGLAEDVTPKYFLYGDGKASRLLGYHVPYSRTAAINVHASEHYASASSTLVHESVHLVDSIERPIRTSGELALRLGAHKAAMLGGAAVAGVLPGPGLTDVMAHTYAYWKLRFGLYYKHLDPSENRARRVQNDEYYAAKYADVIQVGRHAVKPTIL